MPSNSALMSSAHKLANELGVDIQTDGLTNVELVALVSELRTAAQQDIDDVNDATAEQIGAAVTGDETEQKDTEVIDAEQFKTEPIPPVIDKVVTPLTGAYVVAAGKSVACKRGVVGEGETVEPQHIGGGQDSLDRLCDRGYLVKT